VVQISKESLASEVTGMSLLRTVQQCEGCALCSDSECINVGFSDTGWDADQNHLLRGAMRTLKFSVAH
jgi:hypothetical protein